MRTFRFIGLAFCAALAVACSGIAYAFEAPARLVAFTAEKFGTSIGADVASMEATLAQWRIGVGCGDKASTSSLRKASNHFVMHSAKPSEEEWLLTPA